MAKNIEAEEEITETVEQTEPTIIEPSKTDKAVDEWIYEQIFNSPISRNTDAFNHLQSVIQALKDKLNTISA